MSGLALHGFSLAEARHGSVASEPMPARPIGHALFGWLPGSPCLADLVARVHNPSPR
jgi:hypothetical protein